MGKHVFISDDETSGSDDRFLIFTSSVFNVIFDLAGVFFKPWESACKNLCYEETGVDGIDLTNSIREISHDSFNIFYLRCREGLVHYPDDGMLTWLDRFPEDSEERGAFIRCHIAEWSEILKRLELDKRFERKWIENYQLMHREESIFGSPETELRTYKTREISSNTTSDTNIELYKTPKSK